MLINWKEIKLNTLIINKKDLTCKKVSDFSDYIIDVTDVCKINEKLYVAGRSARKLENNNYKEIDNKYIYEIDMAKDKYNSGEIRKIYIGDISHEIIYKRGYVYVSNYDEVLDKGNIIYVLNENGEIVDKMHMKEKVRSMNDIN